MGTHGQICGVDKPMMQDQGLGTCCRRKTRRRGFFRGMMWADNYWLFRDDKEKLVYMANDIIEKLPDLDMEPKPESLWWTSTYKDRDVATLKVGSRERNWDLLFMKVFDVLGYLFQGDGKGTQRDGENAKERTESWWRDGYTYSVKSVPSRTKCHRVVSHVFSTAANGSVNWFWTVVGTTKSNWESKILQLPFRPRKRREVWSTGEVITVNAGQTEEVEPAEKSRTFLESGGLGVRWRPVMIACRSLLGWMDCDTVERQECLLVEVKTANVSR